MANCCSEKSCEIEALRDKQSKTLKIVLAINAVMFVVELSAGILANSVSLIADSLDMLGDALVYIFSIYVIARGARMKAFSAMFKGAIMAAFGLFVLGQAIYSIMVSHSPSYEAISIFGVVALLANAICLALLWQHKAEDINMSSVWLCSRNDIIANISVIAAGIGVWLTSSAWPDIIVGFALAFLFMKSAIFVLKEATLELKTATS
ncbi:cation transporter [Aliiglaciecola lipolytica]|uniref:Cation efflux protein n=1 Tax=Aliiglaciecola lipolytica E3 TaxID=1127673 RepID=K6X7K7_9ALTE|nr:cation transporter [Aliiglaciecola lipolytica]GAC16609.1 cation efflux protein [Aliiglaciecola lipolytica E3]